MGGENWDLWSLVGRWLGRFRPSASSSPRTQGHSSGSARGGRQEIGAPKRAKPRFEDPEGARLRRFRGHLELDEIEAALGVYRRARRKAPPWQPPAPDRRELIRALLEAESWDDAIEVMEDYVREVDNPAPRVRLKLAQLLIHRQARPARALKILQAIASGSLPAPLEPVRAELVREAQAMIEEGVLELEDEVGG